jgi:hypothetical protein
MYNNAFTKHCLERMQQRKISFEDMEHVLAKGFYRHDPRQRLYKVEYGDIIIVINYDGQCITVYHEDRNFPAGRHPDLKGRIFRRKRDLLRYPDWKREFRAAV